MKTQFKSAPKGRVSTLVAALAVSSVSLFAQSATEAVTGFDDKGWSADDVRNSAGTNIVNDSTHAPVPGATPDPAAVAAQIYWTNSIGMFGNLGGVSLTGTTTGSGKSTISVLTGSADLAAGDFLSEDFRAIYRWQNTDTENASLAIKIGLRSTQWDDSQDGFTATRSGEAEWDLLLVADPTYNAPPGISPVNGQYITTVVDYSTAQFKLFNQAGNTYFNNTPLAEYIGGDANKQRTLAEWKLLDETEFGGVLFGSGAKIASTQFGFGSGNPNASGILDYAQISYLNEGQTIDFVKAQRYTGPSNEPANYGDSANWGGVSPSLNQNFIVDYDATLEVSGTQNTRSLGIIAGTTDLVLNAESSLVLNSAQNGTLSSAPGATLNVSGPGTLQGSVIETAGTTNFASTAFLDGGELPHPVRDGSGNSRYAMVVVGDGHLTLEDGADVTLVQAGKNVGVRVGEGLGVATLTIENGANLVIGNETDRGFFVVGDFGATGVFNQTGGEVSVVGAVNIGSQGGTGTWNFSKGTFNVGLSEDGTDSNGVSIGARRTGSNPAPTGTLNISGDAELILTRGYLLVGGDTSPTSGGTGVVNQNGGLVRIIKDGLALGSGQSGVAHGTYNLNLGELEIGGTNGLQAGGSGGGTGIFNFGGGTLRVIESDLVTNVVPNLKAGTTSTIDTNGLNATFSGGFAGTGGFTKTGEGALILNGTTDLQSDSTVSGLLKVGAGSGKSGTLNLSSDLTILVTNTIGRLQVGVDGGTGTANFTTGASFKIDDSAASGVWGTLDVGRGTGSIGTVSHSAGLVDISGGAFQLGYEGGHGTYTIGYGAEVKGSTGSTVYVGDGVGGQGTLNILNGGKFTQGTTDVPGTQIFLGNDGGVGKIHQQGEDSVVSIVTTNPVHIGYNLSGVAGATGTYQLDDGSLTMGSENGNGVRIGESAGTTGHFIQNGGTSHFVLNNVYVGQGGTGVFTLNNNGSSTIEKALVLGQAASSTGTVNLNGGILEVGGTNGIAKGAGSATFNLGGGTIRVIENDLTTSVPLNLIDGTSSTINTNGLKATLTGGITGTFSTAGGDLHKAGSGTLILNGGTYNGGDLKVDGGTIQQESGTVQFWYGSIGADGNTGTYVLNGGNFNPRDLNVGDFGGNGTFIQNGGTVQVASDRAINIGNRGGTGVYTITNGELYLNAYPSINILGRHDANDGASVPSSHGTLNIQEDALVDLAATGYVILGSQVATTNNPSIAQGSTGTINQTGGTFTVNSGALLYLSAVGSGTYNLDGGFLEIGGGSLIPRYGSNNADYAFNLGGGTIRVIDSDLVTSAVPTLKAGTVSTINTDGRNATFSGGFAGTGGFNKVGRGALTLGDETTVSTDSTVQGDLVIGSGAGNEGTLNVEDDVTLDIVSVPGQTGASASSRLVVGTNGGEGYLNINGGHISVDIASGAGPNRVQIGYQGGTGVGTMTDGSITFNASPGTYGSFDIGRGTDATGTFIQSGGVVDLGGGAFQIGVEGGDGTYTIGSVAEVKASTGSTVYVGDGVGGQGTLNILNGGKFTQGTTDVPGTQIFLGNDGGVGKIHQQGEDSVVSIVTTNPVHIGYNLSGVAGATGTYQLDDGSLTMGSENGNGVRIGESAGTTGHFIQNGGTSHFVLNNVYVGQGGTGVFTLNNNGTATVDKALVIGQAASSTGTVNLNGGTLEVGGTNGIAKGSGTATFNLGGGTIRVIGNDLTTSLGMTLLDETTSTIDTNGLNATFTGVLYGEGGLTKIGSGKLTVTAENTYTGETRVTGGTLSVSGSIASSSLTTVEGGGILAGTGIVGALDIADGGVLSPGNSPGTLTAADTTWSGGGIYVWELNSAIGSAGTNWDLLDVTDTLTIQSTLANPFIVQIHSLDSTGQPGALEDFDPTQTYSWIIASAGNVAGFSSEAFSVNTSNFVNLPGSNRFTVTSDGTNIYLNYSVVVPEPATYGAIIALGLLTLAAARRRRM